MLHLIVGGVFERHPDLQVVWTEMWGLRWAVDELDAMTRRLRNIQSRFAGDGSVLNYSQTFGSPVTEGLSLTPLEYFARNCSIGASMLPRHDVRYRHVLGVDRILWGTDFPHDEGCLGENAGRLYGFDLDVLAPLAARIGPSVQEVAVPLPEPRQHPGEAFSTTEPLGSLVQ